ncbi:MAG TPA: hypothetical protein VNP98_01900 [Chthoniobacterales bacterium]|nr:hypothetical protein [Chthoniobacterales bacterium]
MPDTFQSVLIGAVAGILSSVITYFSTRAKVRLDLGAEYDRKLQESRLAAYITLWAMLEPLARYGRDKPVTYAVLQAISTKTRMWYFQVGGIYLTRASVKLYFKWKELMQPFLEIEDLAKHPETPIPETELNAIIAAGSDLRTSLSEDLRTKRLSRL